MGHLGAVLVELPVIVALSAIVARGLVRRFAVPPALGARRRMGALAFALLMAAELALSVLLFGRTPEEHWATYRELPAQLRADGAGGLRAAAAVRWRAGRPRGASEMG